MDNSVVISPRGIRAGLGEGVGWDDMTPFNTMTFAALSARFRLEIDSHWGRKITVSSLVPFIWEDAQGQRTSGLHQVTLSRKLFSGEIRKL